jgi:NADPH:quinone reductase-like Zn-dependent oxidoreductase
MEKFARWGAGDAPGSALLDCKEVGVSVQSDYRWRKEYGAHQKGLRRGVIDMVGEGVNPDRIGERVWAWNGQWQRPIGTAAQYVVLPELQAVELPAAVEFAAAACLGIPATTTFHAIHMLGDITGKTMLVVGASSAVGHYATQFAAMGGAKVIGTVAIL